MKLMNKKASIDGFLVIGLILISLISVLQAAQFNAFDILNDIRIQDAYVACGSGDTQGIVGYWSLDEISGSNALNTVNPAKNLTTVNSPAWVAGKINNALQFNGNTQYATSDALFTISYKGNASLEAWVMPNKTIDSYSDVIGWQRDSNLFSFNMIFDNTGHIYCTIGNPCADGVNAVGPVLQPGVWTHVACTTNNSQVSIYINGTFNNTGFYVPTTGSPLGGSPNSNGINIGVDISGSCNGINYYFNGTVDEAAVYNRTLNDSEIAGHYSRSYSGAPYCPVTVLTACGDTIASDTNLNHDLNCAFGNGLNINASGITLDCQGHNITGPGIGGGTIGINAFNSSGPGFSLTIKNCTISDFTYGISAYGADKSGSAGNGWDGGSITLINSILTGTSNDINTHGGIAFVSGGFGGSGGAGGNITLTNSNLTTISSYGGNAANSGANGGNGGIGGIIIITNSNLTTISSYGGNGAGTGTFTLARGGVGANISLANSTAATIDSHGGNGAGGLGAGGWGGNVNLTGSSIISIDLHAGRGTTTGGSGGSATIKNSNITTINSYGGGPSNFAGYGGNIEVIASTLNLSNVYINIAAGSGASGIAGTLKLNQTELKNSYGIIKFFYAESKNTTFSSIMNISNNSITLNSNTYPEYNVSANLTLNGIPGFVRPIIIRNGAECNSTTSPSCFNFTSLSGTVMFNVSSFTNYSVGEGFVCGSTLTTNAALTSDLKNSTGGTICPGNGLYMGANNIVLDCQSHAITGNGSGLIYDNGIGIYLSGRNNVTIKNCNISSFSWGIYVNSSSNTNLLSNIIGPNLIQSIDLESSPYSFILNNTAYNRISLGSSTGSNITGNKITTNWVFIQTDTSDNLLINNNILTGPSSSNGIGLSTCNKSNIINNTISGVVYDGIAISYSSNDTLANNNITSASHSGITLFYASYCNVFNNTLSSNDYNIYMGRASNSSIFNNVIANSTEAGIYLSFASDNRIYNNLFNNTVNVYFNNIYRNYWNTTRQVGARISSNGTNIGGNYWTNSSSSGFSDTCADSNYDGFCDSSYTLDATGPNIDYLPLSDEYVFPACGDTMTSDTNLTHDLNCAFGNGLNVGAYGITLDCQGHNIAGPGIGGGTIGINAFNSSGQGFSLTIKNCTISDFTYGISAYGANGGSNSWNGWAGGSITLINSILIRTSKDIDAHGGTAAGGDFGGAGGAGGSVVLTNSNLTTIDNHGGNAAGSLYSGYPGGAGGSVVLTNSNLTLINSYGGNAESGMYGGNLGGSGGAISLTNSTAAIINSSGGDSSPTNWVGGTGGTINILSSSIIIINSHGGKSIDVSGGNGSTVIVTSSSLNLTAITVNITGGSGSTRGTAGTLKLNNTELKNSYGIIKFFYAESKNTTFSQIMNISNNSIYLDSNNYPDYNVSANLTLYSLTFSNPRILRNDNNCPASICTFLDYSAGTLVFNVTGFTNYSVDELCGGVLTQDMNLDYNLLNCPANGLNIGASNIMIDCHGHSINGSGSGYGINVAYNNITIKNCNISNFNMGIYLSSSNNKIINSNASGNQIGISLMGGANNNQIINSSAKGAGTYHGIYISSSDNNTIINSVAQGGDNGILIGSSTGNHIINTSANGAVCGISLVSVLNSQIIDSNASGSTNGIVLTTSSDNNQIINSNVNGTGGTGWALNIHSSLNNTISNSRIKGTDIGVHIRASSNNNKIISSSLQGNWEGIMIEESSSNNQISRSNLSSIRYGVYLVSSSTNTTLINNNLSGGINDLYIDSSSAKLQDQPVRSYSFGSASLIFEDSNEGKIEYIQAVTQTGTNLSDDIKISDNLIEVNSSQTGLNKSANLTLYNIPSMDYPKILRNGAICPSSICKKLSPSLSGTVVFNVTSFTNYSIGSQLGCGDTITSDTNLTQNLTGCSENGLNIGNDNLVIDCKGFKINGTGSGDGINASAYTNLTVKNCIISNFAADIKGTGGITVRDSEVAIINSMGGDCNGCPGGNGGDVNILNSNVTNIDASGGDNVGGGLGVLQNIGGNGGNVTIIDSKLNLTIINTDVSGGSGIEGSGEPGSLKLNNSEFYNPDGIIKFFYAESKNTTFSSIMNISNNSIYLDSNNYPGYNVSVNLTLNNIPVFSNPAILRNGVKCDETTSPSCYNFTALSGTVVFNVSSFTNYSIGEGAAGVNAPENFTASLAANKQDIVMNWSAVSGADGYKIWYDDNVTKILQMNESATDANVTLIGQNNNSWIDVTANLTQKRFYALASYKSSVLNFTENRTGKFDIEIKASTGIPGSGNELEIISLPLIPYNFSINNILLNASDGDYIYRFNTTSGANNYQAASYFAGFGWFGDFNEFDLASGYEFKPVSGNINISIAGIVPTGNITIPIRQSTGIPGSGNELNEIGWNSPKQGCNISALIPNANDNDYIYRFNTTSGINNYQSASYFAGFGWFGDFDCFDPGLGYVFKPVGGNYDFTYAR
jgi:parallel beta-helix repeat protein